MSQTPAGFAGDLFAGTAEAYLRHRLPYPDALLSDVLARMGPIKGGRLLDLGCGPGRVTLALANRFAEAWAIDFEAEMIAVARAEAGRLGIANVRFLVGAAEALEAPAGAFDLVTAGDSFHRLDHPVIVPRILEWLRPGGAVVILGGEGVINGDEPWQRVAQTVVRRFTDRPSPMGPTPTDGIAANELMLRAAGFEEVESLDFVVEHDWTADTIIGHLYSTSYCSRAALGQRAGEFERELKAALGAAGTYRQPVHFGYTFARKAAPPG